MPKTFANYTQPGAHLQSEKAAQILPSPPCSNSLQVPADARPSDNIACVAPITLDVVKCIVTIYDVWKSCSLPGTPAPSCCSPFRRDRKPSFSIYDGGRRFHDHGDGSGGDVIDFLQLCDGGMDFQTAVAYLKKLAECKIREGAVPAALLTASYANLNPVEREKPSSYGLRVGSEEEFEQLAALRHLTVDGLKLASNAGVLKFSISGGRPCWLVLDASCWCIEARRMDGKLFPISPRSYAHKAHTLKSSSKNWPVGIATVPSIQEPAVILVTEGGPDLLAAYDLCQRLGRRDCRPVAILGRTTCRRIHPEALPAFSGKRVRIFPHADEDGGGIAAAINWAQQIREAGAVEVDYLDLKEAVHPATGGVKDLNDLVRIAGNHIQQLSPLLP